MAQRHPPKSQSRTPDFEPALRVPGSQIDGEISERLALGQELVDRFSKHVRDMAEFQQLENEFRTWDEYNEELLRRRFTTSKVANEYKRFIVGIGGRSTPEQELHWLRQSLDGQQRKLTSIRQRLNLYDSEVEETAAGTALAGVQQGTRIFVVHGHNGDVKLQLAEFLERITGERPIILHEQAHSGRTIIEMFEDYASEAGFAVVLLTADDAGNAKGATTPSARARQNVVFELGFFFGKLGRSRVIGLYEDGVELPSDINGVLYTPLTGNWHTELVRELQAAGINVDLSKLV
jgi:predicted nucleotide-binding protein